MTCALCGCALKGFADGVMVEQRVLAPRSGRVVSLATVRTKILVCQDDDACGARRAENEARRIAGESA